MDTMKREMQKNATARDWPDDFPHENGTYSCRCITCDSEFIGHKRRFVCRECANRAAAHVGIEPV